MGAELAAAADAVYKAWVEATPAYRRMQEECGADAQTARIQTWALAWMREHRKRALARRSA